MLFPTLALLTLLTSCLGASTIYSSKSVLVWIDDPIQKVNVSLLVGSIESELGVSGGETANIISVVDSGVVDGFGGQTIAQIVLKGSSEADSLQLTQKFIELSSGTSQLLRYTVRIIPTKVEVCTVTNGAICLEEPKSCSLTKQTEGIVMIVLLAAALFCLLWLVLLLISSKISDQVPTLTEVKSHNPPQGSVSSSSDTKKPLVKREHERHERERSSKRPKKVTRQYPQREMSTPMSSNGLSRSPPSSGHIGPHPYRQQSQVPPPNVTSHTKAPPKVDAPKKSHGLLFQGSQKKMADYPPSVPEQIQQLQAHSQVQVLPQPQQHTGASMKVAAPVPILRDVSYIPDRLESPGATFVSDESTIASPESPERIPERRHSSKRNFTSPQYDPREREQERERENNEHPLYPKHDQYEDPNLVSPEWEERKPSRTDRRLVDSLGSLSVDQSSEGYMRYPEHRQTHQQLRHEEHHPTLRSGQRSFTRRYDM